MTMASSDAETSQDEGNRSRNRFRTKSHFLNYFHNVLSTNEVITSGKAYPLLKSCGAQLVCETESSRNELLKYVWSELEKKDVTPNTGLWNTLISVYIENGCDFDPLDVLKRIWQKSEPNTSTFSMLVQAYAVQGNPNGAMKIVDFLTRKGEKVSEQIYEWLILAFANSGDWDGVREVTSLMRSGGFQLRHPVYGHQINVHAKQGDLVRVNDTLKEMRENDLSPTSRIYIDLLDHLSIGGHADLIEKVWSDVENVELNVNEDLLKPLMQRCVSRGDYKSALIMLENVKGRNKNKNKKFLENDLFWMLQFAQKDINEFLTVSSMIEQHLNQDQFSRMEYLIEFLATYNGNEVALKLFELLLSEKKPVTVEMFRPLLERCKKKKDANEIVTLYKFMIRNGIPLNSDCFKMVIPSLRAATSDTFQLYVELLDKNKIELPKGVIFEMVKRDITLSQLTTVLAISNSKDLSLPKSLRMIIRNKLTSDFNSVDAVNVILLLHKRGANDIATLIDNIISRVVNSEKHTEAFSFLKEMIEKKIPTHSSSYTKLLQSHPKSDKIFELLCSIKRNEIQIEDQEIYKILTTATKFGNTELAHFCIDQINNNSGDVQVEPNLHYNSLILAYSADVTTITKKSSQIKDEDLSEKALKAIQLFDEMLSKGYKPAPQTVRSVVKDYLFLQDIEGANKVNEEYGLGDESDNDYDSSVLLIKAHISRKEYAEAKDLFERLKSESKVTWMHYNEMMRMCKHTGDASEVETLYREMLERKFFPDMFTYSYRIKTHLKAKKMEQCMSIIEEGIVDGIHLTLDDYMGVLWKLVPMGDVENATKISGIIREHYKYSRKTLDKALLLANIKAGKLEDASALLKLLVDVSMDFYSNIAKIASDNGDANYIKNLIDFFKMHNLEYQTIDKYYLSALEKNGDMDGIDEFYNKRTAEGGGFSNRVMSRFTSTTKAHRVNDFTKSDNNLKRKRKRKTKENNKDKTSM